MVFPRVFAASPPPRSLFSYSSDLRTLISPRNVDVFPPRAVPTNQWWGNWLAWNNGSSADSDAIFSNPYTYRVVAGRGLSVSYLPPFLDATNRDAHGAIQSYYCPAGIRNLVLSASEWTARNNSLDMRIRDWDDLGVAVTLSSKSKANHRELLTPAPFAKAYLSMGNAFTTMEYANLHVQLQSDHAFLTVNDESVVEVQSVVDDSFVVTLDNGQKWIVFFFEEGRTSSGTKTKAAPVTLVARQNMLVTTEPFSGIVQVAYVSGGSKNGGAARTEQEDARILETYRRAAGVYATHAELFVEDDGAAFGYEWRLQSVFGNIVTPRACPAQTYLHFALPHLQAMMDKKFVVEQPDLVLSSHTRGPMRAYSLRCNGVDKLQWRFEPQSDISTAVDAQTQSFLPVRGADLPKPLVRELKLAEVLRKEIDCDWDSLLLRDGSYYFNGKILQMLGTRCLVAVKLANTTCPELKSLAATAIEKFRAVMKRFVANQSVYPLVYDTVYKGIISSDAWHKTMDPFEANKMDFGNTVYNDHHYHYGYTVMAAAMLLHLEERGGNTIKDDEFHGQLASFVETLIRDVATPDANDPYFPQFRYFNWFLGHSYSHGVTPMADGKDEESVSEEMNFLYGVAMYGKMTGNARMTALAKLMMKVNTLAVKTYFLIEDVNSGIHPPDFAKHRVTGILQDNKCDYRTWFSTARECIHGIQMIPVSPINDVFRTREFVEKEWRELLQDLDCVTKWETLGSGWTSLLFSNAAVLDPKKALAVLKSDNCKMDDGLSRAWALYMAATRTTLH